MLPDSCGGGRGTGPVGASIYRLMRTALVCPDKFRGTLTAAEAAAAMAAGLRRAGFEEIREIPLADGGDGTLDALLASRGDRAAPPTSPARSVIPSTPSGRCCPAVSRSWRWRGRAGSRSSTVATTRSARPTRGTGELIATVAAQRRAPGDRRRRRQRDDRRRARRGRDARLVDQRDPDHGGV